MSNNYWNYHSRAKELFVIEKIASQLAVAIENAQLYEEMRQLFQYCCRSDKRHLRQVSLDHGSFRKGYEYSRRYRQDMGLDEESIERVRMGGLLTEAAQELVRCAGTRFDPAIVDCFCSRINRLVKDPAVHSSRV